MSNGCILHCNFVLSKLKLGMPDLKITYFVHMRAESPSDREGMIEMVN